VLAIKPGCHNIEAVMRDIWTERIRGYAQLEFDWRSGVPHVWAWRAQGDIYRFAQEPVDVYGMREAASSVQAFDAAISRAIEALHSLTVSEALEAGERRRFARR
jgi:hypothetical protein